MKNEIKASYYSAPVSDVGIVSEFESYDEAKAERQRWYEIFTKDFYLEEPDDFLLSTIRDPYRYVYITCCYFPSPVGRYVYWNFIYRDNPLREGSKLVELFSR